MPRIVDHDQRRAELAGAAMQLMLREGLDGVTVRGVATEAGLSTGALRHYFATQLELQDYAVRATTVELRNRVLPRVGVPRSAPSPVDAIAEVVEELLPLDEVRREEYALWSAVTEWKRKYPPEDGSGTWQDQRGLYRQLIAAFRGQETVHDPATAAETHPDPVVEEWAGVLHTFVDGLASQLTVTPGEVTAADARKLLRSLLNAMPRAGSPRP